MRECACQTTAVLILTESIVFPVILLPHLVEPEDGELGRPIGKTRTAGQPKRHWNQSGVHYKSLRKFQYPS
jgi:hypothetical protein